MRRLDTRAAGFEAAFASLQAAGAPDDVEVQGPVLDILQAVRRDGDAALIECTQRFDG